MRKFPILEGKSNYLLVSIVIVKVKILFYDYMFLYEKCQIYNIYNSFFFFSATIYYIVHIHKINWLLAIFYYKSD